MTKITQKQLIDSLKQLKEIKPRKEWVFSLKSQILASPVESLANESRKVLARKVSFIDVISAVFAPRKLAYSFAVVLFLIVGIFGFANYTVPGDLLFPVKKIAEQSQAALTGQAGLRQDVAILNSRISDLAQVSREGRKDSIPSAISEINANASQLVKNLKDNPKTDSATIKEIASSLKTLASVAGTDLSENSDVKDLYQAVVQSQIADLQKATLTDGQKNTLAEAEELYNQGKYTDALEKILLINK